MMTLKEVEYKIKYYRDKVQEYETMRDQMTAVLELDDYDKPFKNWTMNEQQQLLMINEKAFDFLNENNERNIYDWNYTAQDIAQVKLKG